jgi:hypothetical protein
MVVADAAQAQRRRWRNKDDGEPEMMAYITRGPSKCVACGHQLGQPHDRRCPLQRFV